MSSFVPATATLVGFSDVPEAAWAASLLAAAPRPHQAYVPRPGGLTPEQARSSDAVAAGLAWLGRHDPGCIASVIVPPPPAAGHAHAGEAPRLYFADALAAARWPTPPRVKDLSGAAGAALSSVVGADPAKLSRFVELSFAPLVDAGADGAGAGASLPAGAARFARVGWGRYGEGRVIYTSELFMGAAEPRTVHLGVDLEAPAGTPVRAALAGVVHSVGRNAAPLDYGPTVIVEHVLHVDDGDGVAPVTLYTLYGHLSLSSLVAPDGAPRLARGHRLAAGDTVGWVGGERVNGGWPPHVHFQIDTEVGHGGWAGDYPGVCAASDWPAYAALCPDANLLLRCPYVEPVGWDAGATGAGVRGVRVE